MIEVLKLWLPTCVEENNWISQQRQPPMQPCTPIIPHFNMKSLKTPNSLITPQDLWCNFWKLKLPHMVVLVRFTSLHQKWQWIDLKWNFHAINEITQHAFGDPTFFLFGGACEAFLGFWCSHEVVNYAPNVFWCVFKLFPIITSYFI